jgi:microcystin degradation protein MlrC
VLASGTLKFDWDWLPTVDYRATPSAIVADEVLSQWWADFLHRATPAIASGVDAIYLVLHGAMVTRSIADVEGWLLEQIRSVPGLESLPIFGVFDLHANFSASMARHADCLVGYRENPHTDARAAAQTAAGLLHLCLTTGSRPHMQLVQTGIVWPPTGTGTAADPMLSLNALARQFEDSESDLWSASVTPGFAFADTPDTGLSLLCCGTSDMTAPLDCMHQLAEDLQELGMVTEPPVDQVLTELFANGTPPGLSVIVEPSDNIGAGAPGDCTGLLRALLHHGIRDAAVCLADPESVQQLQQHPLGSTVALQLGGKGWPADPGPLAVQARLLSLHDGHFELEDQHSHLASMSGDHFNMGPSAVVQVEGVLVLLTSIKTPPFDLAQWRSVGIHPEQLSLIGVKAAVAHRRAYDPIATRMLWVDTPGPCSSDLSRLRG